MLSKGLNAFFGLILNRSTGSSNITFIYFAFSLLLCFAFLMFILQFFHFKLMMTSGKGRNRPDRGGRGSHPQKGVLHMARNKNNTLNPAMYNLTQQDVDRVIRIHSMRKGMDEDAFEQMETAAESIKLVSSLKQLAGRPVA